MEKITLNNKTKSKRIELNPENKPFFVIKGFSYKSLDESIVDTKNIEIFCELTSKQIDSDSANYTLNLNVKEKQILNERDTHFDFIEFSILNTENTVLNYEVDIHYENELFDTPISGFNEFEEFYSLKNNTKILFSAPFGQGKTTYLKYFFEQKRDSVELFRLFPVNYSVSHNDDIFQYIKCEILLQLLENENIKFDKEKLSHLYTLPEFAKKNVHRFLAPFIHLIPKVGGDLYKIYEKLYELGTEYFDYHHSGQVDDEKEAEKFIEQLIEKEGSIFENNFFTQLIRQLITDIKESGKETVLVIDDLDRIDPDHIFRILNVFAAHFDTDEKTQDGLTNKFGFDKIILVCDYHNLLKIFKHRYGHDTDYGGYINKFYSQKHFCFYSNSTISKFIQEIPDRNESMIKFKELLEDLNHSSVLSLRDVLKLRNLLTLPKPTDSLSQNLNHTYYYHIKLLTQIINIEDLKAKFEICKNHIIRNNTQYYSSITKSALICLAIDNSFKTKGNYFIRYNTVSYNLICDQYYIDDGDMLKPTLDTIHNNVEFTKEDFYAILILIIEKFKTRLTTK
jgi:hypothetical protein